MNTQRGVVAHETRLKMLNLIGLLFQALQLLTKVVQVLLLRFPLHGVFFPFTDPFFVIHTSKHHTTNLLVLQ